MNTCAMRDWRWLHPLGNPDSMVEVSVDQFFFFNFFGGGLLAYIKSVLLYTLCIFLILKEDYYVKTCVFVLSISSLKFLKEWNSENIPSMINNIMIVTFYPSKGMEDSCFEKGGLNPRPYFRSHMTPKAKHIMA